MKFGTREIVFLVVLAAIPVASWWFVFRPADARNAEMMEQIETRQEKLRALNRATATIGNLKGEIASLDEAIEFFRSKLPSEKEIDKVLQEVWRLAEANKLTTKSIRTLTPTGRLKTLIDLDGPYAGQPISMKLEGPFTGFYALLLALEAQPRIMRIQQLTIEDIPKGKKGHVQVNCTVSVFFERSNRG